MKEFKVRLTFTEEVLGTCSNDPNIHEEFIASKAPDAMSREQEIEAIGVDEVVEKSKTVFPKLEDGTPFIWDYQIRGYFKEACGMLRKIKDAKSKALTNYKKVIDGLIFVKERKIPIDLHGGVIGSCQRPLRGQTAQGERISLANSETIPAGSTIEFTVILLDDSHEKLVKEWLDYGRFKGMLQWRNSGKGKFEWEEI